MDFALSEEQRSRVETVRAYLARALRRGQEALCVTERAVFRPEARGLALVESAPGVDAAAEPFARAERKLAPACELGAPLLCLCSSVAEEASGEPERIAADLAELADLARQYGLRVGYEALAWGRHVKDWTAAWGLIAKADRANLGIVLDSFHICVRGNPIAPIAALPADRIALVQVADAPALAMDPLSLSRHYRCYPGQGDHPVVEYLAAVVRTGYNGPVSLEIFNEQFRGASAAAIAVDGMRSLRAVDEAVSARGAAALAPLPPAPKALAPEFLEFAVSDRDAPDLVALLEGLGFARTARHRTKAVDLFQQGGVNFVVNCEKDTFPHSFQLLHGASVCALTLRVDSVGKAMERARAMDCPGYDLFGAANTPVRLAVQANLDEAEARVAVAAAL